MNYALTSMVAIVLVLPPSQPVEVSELENSKIQEEEVTDLEAPQPATTSLSDEPNKETPEELKRCSCLETPPLLPKDIENVRCCNQVVLSELVKAGFQADKPAFLMALVRADTLITGAEDLLVMDPIEDPEGVSPTVEELVSLIRINLDRILWMTSPMMIMLYKKLGDKFKQEDGDDANVLEMGRIVRRAKERLEISYADEGNLRLGVFWDRANELVIRYRSRLKGKETLGVSKVNDEVTEDSSRKPDSETAMYDICGLESGAADSDEYHFELEKAVRYYSSALELLGKNESVADHLKERLLVSRARTRGLVAPGSSEELDFLKESLNDAEYVLNRKSQFIDIYEEALLVYGQAITRLVCREGQRGDSDTMLLVKKLITPFDWNGKERLLLKMVHHLSASKKHRSVVLRLLEEGYRLIMKRMKVLYVDLIEGWPEEYVSGLFHLNRQSLRVTERATASGLYLRERVRSAQRFSASDCVMVQEYIDFLMTMGTTESVTHARSLDGRVKPQLCGGQLASTDNADAGQVK